jgi:hypothetical protein
MEGALCGMSDARRGSPFVLLRQTARLLETAHLENKETTTGHTIDVGAGQGSVSFAVLTSALRV